MCSPNSGWASSVAVRPVPERLDAPDPGPEFVQPGVHGVPPHPKVVCGEAGGPAAIGVGHLGLEEPPLVPGEQGRSPRMTARVPARVLP